MSYTRVGNLSMKDDRSELFSTKSTPSKGGKQQQVLDEKSSVSSSLFLPFDFPQNSQTLDSTIY